jgi:hypothetical protein
MRGIDAADASARDYARGRGILTAALAGFQAVGIRRGYDTLPRSGCHEWMRFDVYFPRLLEMVRLKEIPAHATVYRSDLYVPL